jgi:heme exporter protein D
MAEFFHMGGYAFYVWASYGLSAVVILAAIWWSLRDYRMQKGLVAQLEALSGGRVRRAASAPRNRKDEERQ